MRSGQAAVPERLLGLLRPSTIDGSLSSGTREGGSNRGGVNRFSMNFSTGFIEHDHTEIFIPSRVLVAEPAREFYAVLDRL